MTHTTMAAPPLDQARPPLDQAAPEASEHAEHAPTCCGGEQASGCCGAGESGHHGYIGNKEGYLRRLKRIEGQARGLHRMVEEEQYCIDILTQISAVTKALQSVALGLLEDHLNHCVLSAAQAGGQEAEDKMAEASEAIARLVRS